MVTVEITATCERCKERVKHHIPISQLHNRWWKPKDWTWVSAEVGPDADQPASLRIKAAVLVCPKCQEKLKLHKQKHAGISMGVKT